MSNKTQFAYRRTTQAPAPYRVGGPLVPWRGPAGGGGPPAVTAGTGGGGGGFGQQNQGPVVNPMAISWWWIPLGCAGVVQFFAWLVSRR